MYCCVARSELILVRILFGCRHGLRNGLGWRCFLVLLANEVFDPHGKIPFGYLLTASRSRWLGLKVRTRLASMVIASPVCDCVRHDLASA